MALSMQQSRSEDQPSLQKGESLEGKTSFLRENSLRLEFQIDVQFKRDLLVSPGEPCTCREQGQSLASYFIPLHVSIFFFDYLHQSTYPQSISLILSPIRTHGYTCYAFSRESFNGRQSYKQHNNIQSQAKANVGLLMPFLQPCYLGCRV